MKNSSALVVVALLGALSLPAFAQDRPANGSAVVTASEPGKGTIAGVVKVTGTVEAMDLQKRQVTIKGPRGKLHSMDVGPDVRNLEQVKVGDRVVVRYAQALTLTLMKDGKELRSRIDTAGGDRTPAGARPGGVIGQKVEVTADVIAVNKKTRMVTLRGPEHVVDLKVEDPAQLKLVKVGDQVHAVYTEAVALSVEPAASARK